MKTLGGNGGLTGGSPTELEEAAESALRNARWNVDPAGMPAAMKKAWLEVEFGNYAGAAVSVKGGLKSAKPDMKAAAEKLHEFVQGKLQAIFTAAKQAGDADKKWEAYKAYSLLLMEFKGYEIPAEAETAVKNLAGDDVVKAELAALKRLDAGRKLLEQLAEDAPTSEAAQQAKQLIGQANAGN